MALTELRMSSRTQTWRKGHCSSGLMVGWSVMPSNLGELTSGMGHWSPPCHALQLNWGGRSADITRHYRTIQCARGLCTCTYDYVGTAKNPLFNCRDVQPFEGVCTWLHDALNVPREEQFDEVVANVYSREKDQYIGPHTDQNALLGITMKSSACRWVQRVSSTGSHIRKVA